MRSEKQMPFEFRGQKERKNQQQASDPVGLHFRPVDQIFVTPPFEVNILQSIAGCHASVNEGQRRRVVSWELFG